MLELDVWFLLYSEIKTFKFDYIMSCDLILLLLSHVELLSKLLFFMEINLKLSKIYCYPTSLHCLWELKRLAGK